MHLGTVIYVAVHFNSLDPRHKCAHCYVLYLLATRKNYPQNGRLFFGEQVNKIFHKNTAISLSSLGLAEVFVFTNTPLKKCPVHKKKMG
jgi:hypothetical protein